MNKKILLVIGFLFFSQNIIFSFNFSEKIPFATKSINKNDYLAFNLPSKNISTDKNIIIVSGKANKAVTFLFLNEQEIKLDKNKSFLVSLPLNKPGENTFLFKAYLKNNKFFTKELKINKGDKGGTNTKIAIPKIELISPAENNITSELNKILFKGTVNNVAKLTINGKNVPINNESFSYQAILDRPGEVHDFEIIAYSENNLSTKIERNILYKPTKFKIKENKIAKATENVAIKEKAIIKEIAKTTKKENPILTTSIKPVIEIIQPGKRSTSNIADIAIKGKAIRTDKFFINNKLVPLTKNGGFDYPYTLTKNNENNRINLKAISTSGEISSAKIEIYYQNINIVSQNTNIALSPQIEIISPAKDFISTKNTVLFKGNVKNSDSLYINEEKIPLKKAGKFYCKLNLLNKNIDNIFLLKAIATNGEIAKIERKIYYKSEEVIPSINDLMSVGTENIASLNNKPLPELVSIPIYIQKTEKKSVPYLAIISPSNNYISTANKVIIKGKAINIDSLSINTIKIKFNKDGAFSSIAKLTKLNAINTFVIKAINAEIEEVRTLNIFYKNKLKPLLTISQPADTQIEVRKSDFQIKGTAKNTKELKINDQLITLDKDDNFEFETKLEKTTTFKIVAISDDDIIATKNIKALFSPPKIPTINIQSPANNYITSYRLINIKGAVENVDKLFINNTEITINKDKTFAFKAELAHENAYNEFNFLAKSKAGDIQQKLRIFFKKKLKPELDIIYPTQNNVTLTNMDFSIKGNVKNTRELKINDQVVSVNIDGYFEFNTKVDKNTTFVLSAISNDNLVITKNIKISYITPKIPHLTILTPANNYITTDKKVYIKGKVENVNKILINNTEIVINKDNTFSCKAELEHENAYNEFNFLAKSKTGDIQQTLKIFFKKRLKPELDISYPTQNNLLVTKSDFQIKGSAKNTKELRINDQLVALAKDNSFVFNAKLTKNDVFNIIALSADNLIITENIYVNYVDITLQKQVMTPKQPSADVTTNNIKKPEQLVDLLKNKISIELADADIKTVLQLLAKKGNLNIVSDKTLIGVIDISLKDIMLKDAIDLVLNSQGLSYKIIDNTIVVGDENKLKMPTTIKTAIVKLNHLTAKKALAAISSYVIPPENIQAIDGDNLLIVNAEPKKIIQILEVIKKIDGTKVPQIILEANILEVSTSALKGLGVAWPETMGVGAAVTFTGGNSNIQGNTSITAIINSLEQSGNGKLLARPNIKAIDQEEAAIFIGDKIPYTETTIDSTGKTTEAVKFVDSGITLKIKPNINMQEKLITIKIEPEVSFIQGWKGKNSDIPWVRSRKVSTTVSLKDGETVIIGGLFNSSDNDTNSKLPFLGDVPLLGGLFSSNKLDRAETQLVITVTPKIIFDDPPSDKIITSTIQK